MATPPDFEFQLGRNRTLKGRGWLGLLALGLLLIAGVATVTAGYAGLTSVRQTIAIALQKS